MTQFHKTYDYLFHKFSGIIEICDVFYVMEMWLKTFNSPHSTGLSKSHLLFSDNFPDSSGHVI
jgi:hypothetical protein